VNLITPIPKPRKRKKGTTQDEITFDEGHGLSTQEQRYDPTPFINDLRRLVDEWRALPNPSDWKVTSETARLLQHWRSHKFNSIRPFFCQVEAVETAIWLSEVAPKMGKRGQAFLNRLADANNDANPELSRLALKLATGAGKTTVMAMLIAWQTINSVRRPTSKNFTRGFLIVAPGITIKDRLRVLQTNDPDSYYAERELVPNDLLPELDRAKIVITNYHAFKLREKWELAKGNRALLQGRGETLNTLETEGQMLQRVMPDLMGMKNIMAINDEAHHCYREKPGEDDLGDLKGDAKKEAQKNNDAARLWISGIEIVNRKLGVNRVMDLSATPFFLRGSGYAEGTLFPWTMSDFSLMDAIESGIVKLPRVPVADNIPGEEMPMYRNLWEHIGKKMPKLEIRFPRVVGYRANLPEERLQAELKRNHPVKAMLDPFNPSGSTSHVNFNTSKTDRWETDSRRCHINWVVLDSDWEAEFCRVAEKHKRVFAYVKNHALGLEVPYRHKGEKRIYIPDFIVQIDDGRGDPLNLIVEIKGYRGDDAIAKKTTMDTYWVPGVNNLKTHGRWAFAEFCDIYEMQSDFEQQVAARFEDMITNATTQPAL